MRIRGSGTIDEWCVILFSFFIVEFKISIIMFLFWLIPLSLFMMQTAIKSILLYTRYKSVLYSVIYWNTLLFELNDGPRKGSCILTLSAIISRTIVPGCFWSANDYTPYLHIALCAVRLEFQVKILQAWRPIKLIFIFYCNVSKEMSDGWWESEHMERALEAV
jgi:hypothetical protein